MIKDFQNIYTRLGDELSKAIYIDRLNYSITQEYRYLDKMVDRTVRSREEWRRFCKCLREETISCHSYIFGAGIWGRTIYEETKGFIQWSGVIDNQPEGKVMGNLDIMTLEQFMRSYDQKAMIVVSSYKNRVSMLRQLKEAGIPGDRILNAGEVIYSLTEGAIYFDLEEMKPQDTEEVFVDAGGFDGMTTEGFLRWCQGKGYSYCFEFDPGNTASIERRFAGNKNCNIVPKALWSENTCLLAYMKGNYSSSVIQGTVEDEIRRVEAVALDDYLEGRPVTFIKMDIEGAEAEAIKGAENIIRSQHPRLAVSIYHKTEDIWELPRMILEYYSGYRLYLRHYSFSYYDTVLYAVPEGQGER